jgi:hypothetical protein
MGLTAHIERFLDTLRQRCARLVRRTLSFSRRMENHVGAFWYFIRPYSLCRAEGHYPVGGGVSLVRAREIFFSCHGPCSRIKSPVSTHRTIATFDAANQPPSVTHRRSIRSARGL